MKGVFTGLIENYCGKDYVYDEFEVARGRGFIAGLVYAMEARVKSFDKALVIIARQLPRSIDWDCVPEDWVSMMKQARRK